MTVIQMVAKFKMQKLLGFFRLSQLKILLFPLLTQVIPGMFMNESKGMEKFMNWNHQPVAKTPVVHEKYLLPSFHTCLA